MNSHFKEQVDKLTAIINSAVGRKKGVAMQPEPVCLVAEETPPIDTEFERISAMILKMQDGQLEQRYVARLGKWLSCDEKALKYYVEFNQLSAMLRLFYSKNQTNKIEEALLARN